MFAVVAGGVTATAFTQTTDIKDILKIVLAASSRDSKLDLPEHLFEFKA